MSKTFLCIATMIFLATGSILADVKIKTRQTMGSQVSENTTYIKGKRQRTEMTGGGLVSLTQCDLGRDLQLAPQTKTYTVSYYDNATTENRSPEKVQNRSDSVPEKGGTIFVTTTTRDTGERKPLFGFTARHIIQTIETDSNPDACNPIKSKMEIDMWVIDAEFALTCQVNKEYLPSFNSASGGCSDKISSKTVGSAKPGYPLWQKMTTFDAAGTESFSLIQEVIELSKAVLDAGLFDVPADYREVKDSAELYAIRKGTTPSLATNTAPAGFSESLKIPEGTKSIAAAGLGPKQPGSIRVGIAGVKVNAVGESITAADLSAAIHNSFRESMAGTKLEVVYLNTESPGEAKRTECDYLVAIDASHKKGGGGFGFGKMLAQAVGQTGIGHTGSVAGNIAGQIATNMIVTAGSVSANVRSRDELTLDIRVQSATDERSVLSRQFKSKAKSDGEDIISSVVYQASRALIDLLKK